MKTSCISCLIIVMAATQSVSAQTTESTGEPVVIHNQTERVIVPSWTESGSESAEMHNQRILVRSADSTAEPVVIQRAIQAQPFTVHTGAVSLHNPNMAFMSSGIALGKLYPPDIIMRNQDKLNLTSRQADTIKNEMRRFQSDIVDIQWSLNESQAGLDKELNNDRIDVKRTLEQLDRVMKAENDLKKSHMTLLINIRNVLDAGQISLLENMMPYRFGSFGMTAPGAQTLITP